jgi:hypothetical protein
LLSDADRACGARIAKIRDYFQPFYQINQGANKISEKN